MFLFLKNCCSIKYVLLAFFILSCKSVGLLLSSLSTTPKYLKFSTLSDLYFFLFLNVLFYFSLNCFSFPLSCSLSFLGLSVVRTFWQCFPFLQKVFLFQFNFFQLIQCHLHMLIYSVVLYQDFILKYNKCMLY